MQEAVGASRLFQLYFFLGIRVLDYVTGFYLQMVGLLGEIVSQIVIIAFVFTVQHTQKTPLQIISKTLINLSNFTFHGHKMPCRDHQHIVIKVTSTEQYYISRI